MNLLNGLCVVEVGESLKAGYCGKLFVDAGAEVIKVLLPQPPAANSRNAWLDRGKSSVVLDWRVEEGTLLIGRLLQHADILLTDLPPGPDLDLLEGAAEALPKLVRTHISDLGRTGPFATRPASDLVVSALSGMCYINGETGKLPLREPGNQTALVAALAAYLGALAAIANRGQTSRGQSVDVSALEAMVNVLSPSVLQASYQDGAPHRRPSASGFLFDCADGQVSIIISSERSWQSILDIWGLSVEPTDPRLGNEGLRRQNMPAVRELFAPVLATKTRREVFEELCLVRVPCGMLMRPDELPTDPHLVDRNSFEVETSGAGEAAFPGPSFRLAHQVPEYGRSLHGLGEDTSRVLAPLCAEVHS